jgi:ATP-dependent Clp protease ATP-binding subunit ClpA
VPTSADLPVSNEGKRILAYAGEESDRLAHYVIDTDHLLLGILRESTSLAAGVLVEMGIHLEALRESVAKSSRHDRQSVNEPGDKPYEEPWGKIRALMSKLVSMQERSDAPVADAADATEQRSTSCHRADDGTLVAETVQMFSGHRVSIKERFQVADDGKALVLSIEVAGPKPGQRHEQTIKFDLPPKS